MAFDDVFGNVFLELLDNFVDSRVYGRLKEVETAVLALRDLLIERGLTTALAFDLAIDARFQQVSREGLHLIAPERMYPPQNAPDHHEETTNEPVPHAEGGHDGHDQTDSID